MNDAQSTSYSLLQRAIDRDEAAWNEIVVIYEPLIRHWCKGRRVPEHAIQDIFQDVSTALVKTLGKFQFDREGTSFRAWIRGITENRIKNHFSKRGEMATGGSDAQKILENHTLPDESEDISEDAALDNCMNRASRLALDTLRMEFEMRTWAAFYKKSIEGLSTEDVAIQLEMSKDAVRQANSRVKRRVAVFLKGIIDWPIERRAAAH